MVFTLIQIWVVVVVLIFDGDTKGYPVFRQISLWCPNRSQYGGCAGQSSKGLNIIIIQNQLLNLKMGYDLHKNSREIQRQDMYGMCGCTIKCFESIL